MNKRLPLLLSLLGVILLAASLAYWILQLYQPPQRPIAAAPRSVMADPPIDAAATLFGGQVVTASATSYQLTGIVSAGRDSVAIIVAEGSPPKALRVGKELVPGITLAEVHPRYVMLSDGGVMKRLDLAADTKAAAPMGGPGTGMAAPMQPPMTTGTVQEPPMAPGAVPQPAQAQQEYASPGDVGQHDAPPPAAPNSAPVNQTNPNNPNANNPNAGNPNAGNPNVNNPSPAPVQMPPPTRPAPGSPVNNQGAETQ
jgi:general secretion pathway protein C